MPSLQSLLMTTGRCVFVLSMCMHGQLLAQTQSIDTNRTISVQGHAQIMVVPNQLSFSVSVQQRGPNTQILQQAVQQKVANIITLLSASGIADKNIQSMQMSLQPHYEYNNGKRTQSDFILGRTIDVKHDDFSVYSALMEKLIKAGATNISAAQLTHDNPNQQYLTALKLAVEDAKKRASVMLEPLQATINGVLTITEQSRHQPIQYRAKSSALMAEAQTDMAGEQGITARVSVTFLIR